MLMNGSPPSAHSDATYRHKTTSAEPLPSKHQSYATENVHFKILVPSVAAGAVIGKKGDAIAHVQKETGARVKMSKSNDFYPGTSERVCLILGTVEAILRVHDYIMDKIIEKPEQHSQYATDSMTSGNCAADSSEHSPPSLAATNGTGVTSPLTNNFLSPLWNNDGMLDGGQIGYPSLQSSDNNRFPTERHKQVKILVPNSTAGMIIGKGGQFIKEIKEASGAYVQISQKSKDLNINLPERCVIIAGEREHNRNAVRMILQKISEDPQSATCPNISYAEVSGPLPSAYPTGSPFAQLNMNNAMGTNAVTTAPMIRPATMKNSRAGIHRSRLGSEEFGCWTGSSGLSGTKNGLDNAMSTGPISTLPNGISSSNLSRPMADNKLPYIREYLRSLGYSEHAANEILNAIQVLSHYGLFNHQMLFPGRNKPGYSLTFGCADNNSLSSPSLPSMLADKSQVFNTGIMSGIDSYHMPGSPNQYSPSPSIYNNPNLSNVFSSSNLAFNSHLMTPGCGETNVPLMQPLMITSGNHPSVSDSSNIFSNLFSPDYTFHQSASEQVGGGGGVFNTAGAFPYLPYLDQQSTMYEPISSKDNNPSLSSAAGLSESKMTSDMYHSAFALNSDYNNMANVNKLTYNMSATHISGQVNCTSAPLQQETIASIPTSAI